MPMNASRNSPSTDNLYIGKGELYFDRLDDFNAATGELDLGNATAVSITPSITTKEHFSSRRGIKELDDAMDIEKKFLLKFDLEEYSVENLRLAFRGPENNWNDQAYLTQTAGSITNVGHVAKQSRWISIKTVAGVELRNITGGTVVVRNSGGTSMMEGATVDTKNADYVIDYMTGRIYVTYNGRIYDNEAITVSCSYGNVSQPKVLTSNDTKVQGAIRFIGKNTKGPNYEVRIWKCKLRCTSAINFISDDYGKLSFEAEIFAEQGLHPTEPFFRILNLKASTIVS